MANDFIEKTARGQMFNTRSGTDRRKSGKMRGLERRRPSVGEKLQKAVAYHEKTIASIKPKPLTQMEDMPRNYGMQRGAGIRAARSYLAKKATVGTMGRIAAKVNPVAGVATTALELGSAVVGFTRAKRQKQEAEQGTKMLQSGMKSAKLKKSLSKTGREGVPGIIKVN